MHKLQLFLLKSMSRRQAKNWVFTDNNGELWKSLPEGVTYVTHQLEKAPTTGTVHVQGYLQLGKQQRIGFLKKLRPRAHWEIAKGTLAQNQAYTTKEHTALGERVTLGVPKQQGKRVDLEGFREAVRSGKRQRQLFDSHLTIMARYPKLYHSLSALYKPERKERTVIVLYGDPGTGKTTSVHNEFPDCYCIPPTDKLWLPGYDGHDVVLWDDFAGRGSKVGLTLLLQMLDNFPLQLEYKGGHLWFNPKLVILTTNVSPENWYDYSKRQSSKLALSRRINILRTYTHKSVLGTDTHEIVEYKTPEDIIKFF